MAVPEARLTMDSLIARVADKLGVGIYRSDNTLCVPYSDAGDLESCLKMVNRGIQMLIDSAPNDGWHWMERIATVTFDTDGTGENNISSDAARYMLPLDFGGEVAGDIDYAASTAHATKINWCNESVIRGRRALSVNTGYPTLAAIRPYQPTSTSLASGRRWELIVDPQPAAADTVEFPYIMHFDGVRMVGGTADSASSTTVVDATLSEYPDDYFNGWVAEVVYGTGKGSYATVTDFTSSTGTVTVADWLALDGSAGGTDPGASSGFVLKPCHQYYHPVGFTYDNVVEVACLAACELFGGDKVFDTHYTDMFYNRKLKEAYVLNRRQKPRKLGRWTNGPGHVQLRTWETVTSPNDV